RGERLPSPQAVSEEEPRPFGRAGPSRVDVEGRRGRVPSPLIPPLQFTRASGQGAGENVPAQPTTAACSLRATSGSATRRRSWVRSARGVRISWRAWGGGSRGGRGDGGRARPAPTWCPASAAVGPADRPLAVQGGSASEGRPYRPPCPRRKRAWKAA